MTNITTTNMLRDDADINENQFAIALVAQMRDNYTSGLEGCPDLEIKEWAAGVCQSGSDREVINCALALAYTSAERGDLAALDPANRADMVTAGAFMWPLATDHWREEVLKYLPELSEL